MLQQFARNIFSGYSALAVRAVVTLAVNPIYIHSLGNDRYGIWIFAISIMNYAALLDFGLRQALIRFVSKFLAEKNYERLNSIVQSAFMLYSLAAVVVILFSATAAFGLIDLFNIPGDLLFDARVVILIVGIDVAVNFIFMAWGGSAGAFHRFDLLNGALIAESILKALTLVWILNHGYGLLVFAAAFPAFSLLRNIVSAIILKRFFPKLRFGLGLVSEDSLKMIYRFGGMAFLISLAWIFIDNMDRILIGWFLTPEKITMYSVAFVIIVFMRQLVLATSIPLRPVISHLETKGKEEAIRKIYTGGSSYLAWLSFTFAGGVFIFSESFIYLWMGPGYGEAAQVLKIAAFPFALFFSQAFAVSILYGTENHRRLFYLLAIEAVLNFVLSIILVREMGLTGIIWGTVIPQIPLYLLAMPFIIGRTLRMRIPETFGKTPLAMIMAAAVSLVVGAIINKVLPPDNWFYFAVDVLAVALASLYGGLMVLGRKELALLKEYYGKKDSIIS